MRWRLVFVLGWFHLGLGSLLAIFFPEPPLNTVWQLYQNHQMEKARALWYQWQHTHPGSVNTRLWEALLTTTPDPPVRLFRTRQLLDSLKWVGQVLPFYHFVEGIYWMRKRSWEPAIRAFQTAVRLDPLFAQAYAWLGKAYLEQMLEYRDRVTPHEVPISFASFAVEDFHHAREALTRALQLQPDLIDAIFHLGLLYYEWGNIDTMITLFENACQYYPHQVNLWLFLGLGYQEQRKYRQAAYCFEQALQLMPAEIRQQFTSPQKLQNAYVQLHVHGSPERFWAQNDPLYLTPENEFQQEFLARLAYVNLRFRVPALHLEGWQTDRGQAYLFLGKPLRVIRYGKAFEGGSIFSPAELWVYRDFSLMFEDTFWNGLYQLANPELNSSGVSNFKSRSQVDFTIVARRVFQQKQQLIDLQFPGGALSLKAYFARFWNVQQHYPEVFVALEIPFKAFVSLDSLQLQIGWFLRDSVPKLLYRGELDPIAYQQAHHPQWRRFLYAFQVPVAPTRFAYSLEVLETVHQQGIVVRDSLQFPELFAHKFSMSDVVLARRISNQPEEGVPFRHNLFIVPAFHYQFSQKNPINLYFELYNLTQASDNKATYVIENSLVPVKSNIWERIWGETKGVITVVNEYEVYGTSDYIHQQLDVTGLPAGPYRLIIKVTDKANGARQVRETLVTIVN